MFEHRRLPLITRSAFVLRMLQSFMYDFLTIMVVITIGTIGFYYIEEVTWIDAFLEASMFFGGMGSEFIIKTWWGKFFAAAYAILCPYAAYFYRHRKWGKQDLELDQRVMREQHPCHFPAANCPKS